MTLAILVVDDDADCRESLQLVLEDAGYAVEIAGDGREALLALEKGPRPAAILLDLMMPVMDGKQFLSLLRQIPRLQGIPVVILSAATREWSGAHLEVEEVLSKPIDLEVLLSTVNRIFADRS